MRRIRINLTSLNVTSELNALNTLSVKEVSYLSNVNIRSNLSVKGVNIGGGLKLVPKFRYRWIKWSSFKNNGSGHYHFKMILRGHLGLITEVEDTVK